MGVPVRQAVVEFTAGLCRHCSRQPQPCAAPHLLASNVWLASPPSHCGVQAWAWQLVCLVPVAAMQHSRHVLRALRLINWSSGSCCTCGCSAASSGSLLGPAVSCLLVGSLAPRAGGVSYSALFSVRGWAAPVAAGYCAVRLPPASLFTVYMRSSVAIVLFRSLTSLCVLLRVDLLS